MTAMLLSIVSASLFRAVKGIKEVKDGWHNHSELDRQSPNIIGSNEPRFTTSHNKMNQFIAKLKWNSINYYNPKKLDRKATKANHCDRYTYVNDMNQESNHSALRLIVSRIITWDIRKSESVSVNVDNPLLLLLFNITSKTYFCA